MNSEELFREREAARQRRETRRFDELGRGLGDRVWAELFGDETPQPWEIEVAHETEAFLRELCLRRGLEPEQVYEALVRVVRDQRKDR